MVAVTFDDLPATASTTDAGSLTRLNQKLLASVRKHRIPAVGFVNEAKLFEGGSRADVEARSHILEMWLDAGLELGNHTYSHADLNRMPLEAFQAERDRVPAAHEGKKSRVAVLSTSLPPRRR